MKLSSRIGYNFSQYSSSSETTMQQEVCLPHILDSYSVSPSSKWPVFISKSSPPPMCQTSAGMHCLPGKIIEWKTTSRQCQWSAEMTGDCTKPQPNLPACKHRLSRFSVRFSLCLNCCHCWVQMGLVSFSDLNRAVASLKAFFFIETLRIIRVSE